ncbi:MAG: hypothetical protein OXG26_16725 [Caldilineaceae bacterium]|nr:hypothetical protein [Caldilineaceae bacterium]
MATASIRRYSPHNGVPAGDAFFVHYQIAHCASPNVSPHPRYAIYFRLRHVNLKAQLYEALTDIWLEWDGMREIVAQHGEPVPTA